MVAMTYDANDVAKLVVNDCMKQGKAVTNLKLQKILYFMWIDWYAKKGEILFDNRIEAWHYGPAVPDVYYKYGIFAADSIGKEEECCIHGPDADEMTALIRKYNRKTSGKLVDESHASGTPWDRVGGDKAYGAEIAQDLMIDAAIAGRSHKLFGRIRSSYER